MVARVIIGFICLIYFSGFSRADSISNFIILDKNGQNTCIADMHCFLSLHISQEFTLSFDLTLERNIENKVYKVVLENPCEGNIMKKEFVLCYDEENKVVFLTEECSGNANVPAGTYHINLALTIPKFKDIGAIIISGPNGAEGFRGVVSTYSSHPPAQLCNSYSAPC